MRALILLAALLPGMACAGGLGAARTLPAGTVIAPADLRVIDSDRPGLTDPSAAIGMQTRITVYEGRPLHASMLQAPRLISRNQIVRLAFQQGALRIDTEARALDDGAEGALIRAMNLASKTQITAQVMPDGSVAVIR